MTAIDHSAALRASLEALSRPETAAGGGTSPAAADKFKAMMEKPSMAPPHAAESPSMEVASKLVAAQDAELQRSVTDAAEFMQRAPEMNLNELNAGSIRLTYELAATQLDMEAKMGVVNSSKSSIETLMKNQ
ncbi:type III secretion protein HrpB2 [Burkholderia gladioli]|uniref:type III secretion protein HrpB2 n=1 Tax=Burkholderia gladioli TaxID=28095 RepID=UPI000CFEC70C|nr:type III secretion protein HrpB2 [Burkholderia gladioli]MBA1365184.1 type III secretion protein HrpB2 [Burkholderia gladioli]MBU9173208.1 type III secretion protein HrpB2 [Burkholderia gladioli]MCA8170362.1 type III secretion protein HrpB2 [Burkholderia gladioli]MDN7750791.1 type III secretion protein HrpB2 [Burkholderia gladioli]NRF89212.1 type III secretion protein HrpB2 [Burkholderia gladioli]